MLIRLSWLGAALTLMSGCSGNGGSDGGVGLDAEPAEVSVRRDSGESRDASLRPLDALTPVVVHDGGAPLACEKTCDCPQGQACLDGVCGTAGVGPVYCCANPGCPSGRPCLNAAEVPGTCPSPPDAGPQGSADVGNGISAACTSSAECDQTMGLSCWDEASPPYLWDGYCTLEDCPLGATGCPPGSACVNFGQLFTQGCMRTCVDDTDCRGDHYCFPIPGSMLRICYPDCRDDLFDCGPRNGSVYCSRTTGRCEMTTMQTQGTRVGDPCIDNRECGPGQVCMSERAWGLPGGMCTRVCLGLAEATPCGMGETCQSFNNGAFGLCFANCGAGNSCPNRVGAVCDRYDPGWATASCFPQ